MCSRPFDSLYLQNYSVETFPSVQLAATIIAALLHSIHKPRVCNVWVMFIWLLVNVSFIPYFRILVFGILVTLVAWFSFRFFRLAHLALQNVNKDYIVLLYFITSSPKVTKNQKRKMGWTKHMKNTSTFSFSRSRISILKSQLMGWNQFWRKKRTCGWFF